jgi:DNA-binding response OmpR family regulator
MPCIVWKIGEFARGLHELGAAAVPISCKGGRIVEKMTDNAAEPPQDDLRFDDLFISPRLRGVERAGVSIALSAIEFDLLYFLASHPRQVFTSEELLNQVWHYAYVGDTRTVTVQMSRLRKKIEKDPPAPRHLHTVWRVGYKFMP